MLDAPLDMSEAAIKKRARDADALELRRRLLQDNLTARQRLEWLPASVGDAIGKRQLNIAGIKRHYKLLSMLVHPDRHSGDSKEELRLWTDAYKRLGQARSELLGAMGCAEHGEADDEDDAEAQALVNDGRYGAATERYRKAATELTQEHGQLHPKTFRMKIRLANHVRSRTNQTGEAEVLLRHLHRTATREFGPANFDTLQSASGLGLLLQDKGDLDGAEPLLAASADGMTALRGDVDESAITSRAAYAGLLLAKGDLAAAEPRLKEACMTAREALSDDHELTRRIVSQYGTCLAQLGKRDDDLAIAYESAEHASVIELSC